VLGGGSFGTAMGAALARKKSDLDVVMLLRKDPMCRRINEDHQNPLYLPDLDLPPNLRATTDPREAIIGAQYVVHAVPVQASTAFLKGIKDILDPSVPILCVSKGIEQSTGYLPSELIQAALERDQPAVFLSGPSFAKEVHHPSLWRL
jgi:glycerol-3-phosphate dehydrogenase (NAD+)